jgi:hypothetical protein
MGGEAPSDWNRGGLMRRVVNIMSKRDTIGRIDISIQNKFVDQLDQGPGRGKWYRKWKGRFVGIVNIMVVMGITNWGKDNLPPKCLIILAETECFKNMRLRNIRHLLCRARFGQGGCHIRINTEDCGKKTMRWDSSGMLYEMTDGKWKLPGDPGRIKKPCGSINVFLNLVKPNLYVGNQPGSSFLTPPWYCLVMSHNHPYKNSMQQRNIYFIGKFQSKSVNYKKRNI